MREKLIEAVAETDDDLLLKYLEGEMLEVEEIKQSLRRGILERKITPHSVVLPPGILAAGPCLIL